MTAVTRSLGPSTTPAAPKQIDPAIVTKMAKEIVGIVLTRFNESITANKTDLKDRYVEFPIPVDNKLIKGYSSHNTLFKGFEKYEEINSKTPKTRIEELVCEEACNIIDNLAAQNYDKDSLEKFENARNVIFCHEGNIAKAKQSKLILFVCRERFYKALNKK